MPREGIGRFSGKSEFSDVEFLEIFKELLPYIQSGEIDLDSVKSVDMVEKMDSSFSHFGINSSGNFFMETSNSGEVTAADYEQRFNNRFMADFKASFKVLLENKVFQATLKKIFKKVGAIRYDAEIFPVLTHTGDESGYITFVATKYDKSKFGKHGAFVVFKSWLKDENAQWYRPEPDKNIKLLEAIESADTSDWRIYTNEKHAKLSGVVNFKAINVDKMLSSPEAIDEAIEVLKSRGNTTIKAHLKNVIADLKPKLQGVLDKYAEETSSILGKPDSPSSIEGVVLRIKKANGDIFEVKGTSSAFDALKKQTWATRSSLEELEATTEGTFLKDALGLKTAQAAALNRAIKDHAAKFTSKEKNPEKKENAFLMSLFDALRDKDAMVAPEETKKRVEQIFDVAKNQLSVIIDEFKSQKLDPDSKRKSLEALKAIIDKFDTIDKTINVDMPDEAFQLYIFKFLLDRRLKGYAGSHLNTQSQDYNKFYEGVTPVIMWNGRAQPWHRGHDAMIQLAKSKMKELGAEKILICIVKGGKSSNNEENPLTEKDQKALIEAIYKDDDDVIVSDTPLQGSGFVDVVKKLTETNCYMVGWLAGEDRIETYRKFLPGFNANLWLNDHSKLPIKVNSKGFAEVEMIQTPRVMSGTAARESAKTSDFKSWLANVAPPQSQKNKAAVGIYKQIYELLNNKKAESFIRELVWKKFNESVVLNEFKTVADAEKVLQTGDEEQKRAAQEYIDKNKNKEGMGGGGTQGGDQKQGDGGDDDFEKTGDGVEDADGEAGQLDDAGGDIETLEAAGLEISDDGKSLTDADGNAVDFETGENGIVSFEDQPLALIQNDDGTFKEVSPEEAAKLVTPPDGEEQSSVDPESQNKMGDPEKDVGDMQVAFAKNPKLAKSIFGSIFGKAGAVLLWAMEAENKDSTGFIRGATAFVKDEFKKIRDEIKSGKAKAEKINQSINTVRDKFKKLKETLDKEEKEARAIVDEWNKKGGKKKFDDLLRDKLSEFNPRNPDWKQKIKGSDNSDPYIKTLNKTTSKIINLSIKPENRHITKEIIATVDKINNSKEDMETKIEQLNKMADELEKKAGVKKPAENKKANPGNKEKR